MNKSLLQRIFLPGFLLFLVWLLPREGFAQSWTILGNESEISAQTASYSSIAVNNGVPYVVYKDGGASSTAASKVKRRNATTGVWEQFGDDIGTNVAFPRLYLDKTENLYVAYVDVANGSKLAIEKYITATSSWEPLESNSDNLYVSAGTVNAFGGVSQYGTTARFSMAFDSDNNPFVAFSDGSAMVPTVKKFNGTSWVGVSGGTVSTSLMALSVSLVIDEADVPWLAFISVATSSTSTGNLQLYKAAGSSWVSSASSGITGIRHASMALAKDGNLYVGYFSTADLNRATAISYNRAANTWNATTRLGSRDSPNISLISDVNGNLYYSFIDKYSGSTYYQVARVFELEAGTTTWSELRDPALTRGIDEPVGDLTIAVGNDQGQPFIAYTKSNSSSTTTPVVREYAPAPPPAVLTTTEPSHITFGSAKVGGDITDDGGSAITERGVVYGTSPAPTTAGTKVVDAAGGKGVFSVSLSGLGAATFYYARAYAINGGGIPTYGNTVTFFAPAAPDAVVSTAKQMEYLSRGLIAVRKSSSQVYLSWRLLGTDPSDVAFNIYRDGVKLNATPISASSNYEDNTTLNGKYTVVPVVNGVEGTASSPVSIWATNQLTIPLQIPAGGVTGDGQSYTYSANDASVGDVDGDGEYEIILKWDPSKLNDNAGGYSGKQLFDCYKMDGTRLWRIDLGINVNAGPHYNPFMVYDFDGDGKAEIILKTADGTIDGLGAVIGDATVDYRNSYGWVQQGPEYLTVFNGLTGAAMATINYQPARGSISDWGDNYGNRADRFLAAVAYLDGARPSLVVGRGYYEKLVRAAYDWRDGQLRLRWIFNSEDPANPSYVAFSSMGNHQMTIGDVDGDGKDEVINGSSAINDDGNPLWSSGKGHGDALHMTDMDPSHPGMEIWTCLESPSQYSPYGLRQYDAKTGATRWGIATSGDVGRAMAADIDPNHPGYEMWGSSGNLYDVDGNQISTNKPTYNFGIWWDGDLGRELLDGTKLDKWNYSTNSLNRLFTIYQAAPISSNNGTKANPCLQADLFGDWREEVMFRYSDNTALVIFTTTIATSTRIPTLMHDPQYRTAIAWQNSGYNQPPYPSFYVGYDMPTPPAADIYTTLPIELSGFKAKAQGNKVILNWTTASEWNNDRFTVEHSTDGRYFSDVLSVKGAGNSSKPLQYSAVDYYPVAGFNYYRLRQTDFDGKSSVSKAEAVKILQKEQGLKISPNPCNREVKLDLVTSAETLTLAVISMEGKKLLQASGSLQELNTAINALLPSLSSGTYAVTLRAENQVYSQKLLKQ